MSHNRLTVLATTLAATAAIAGCGGSSSSRGGSTPSVTVKTYLTAIGHGDGATACDMLAQSLQTRALSTAHSQGIKASDCPSLFSQVKAHLTQRQVTAFLNAKIQSVSQTGDTATVTVTGGTAQPTLQRTGGKWLITGGIGF